MRSRIPIAGLLLLLSTGTYADDRDDNDNGRPGFLLVAGAGVSAKQSPYVGGSARVEVLPRVFALAGPFYVRGPALGVYLYGGDDLRISAGISLDLADAHRGDGSQLADMPELDDVLLAEIEASYEADWGELGLSFAADVSGTHDGYLAGLAYRLSLEADRVEIEPKIGVKWQSAEVNRHDYGVGPADVRPDRPLYEPDAGLSYELGATVTYRFAERHTLSLEAGIEWLSAEASDSPIVERDSLASAGIGYLFWF